MSAKQLNQMNISEMKLHYTLLFQEYNAIDSDENYKLFLEKIVGELSWNLKVDLSLLSRDFDDKVLCSSRKFGALESLKRVLLPVAETVNYKATSHPDWSLLAGRIEIQRLKLIVPETYSEMLNTNPKIWRDDNELKYYSFANSHAKELEEMLVPERDYDLYFFGVRTLEKSYLMRYMKSDSHLLETPQLMYLRQASFLRMPNIELIKKEYDALSTGLFTYASPTMFHAGITKGSLASCFLLSMQDDLEKIFKCLGQCAMISKSAGGIGLDISNIRHSKISHMGQSSGIVPMLKVYDDAMRYVNQCFDPDTIIYCKDGPKPIKDVVSGDNLVSLNGFGVVAKPMHYKYTYDKEMFSIKTANYFRPVTVAGVHPLYVIKDQSNGLNNNTIIEKLNQGIIKPEFIPVSHLDIGDLIGTPIPNYTNDLPIYTTNDCYMYGIMVTFGYCYKKSNEFGIKLHLENDKNILDFVKIYLSINTIKYEETVDNKNIHLKWTGGSTFPFSRKMLYDKNEKIIHHSMIHLPKEKCASLLQGVLQNCKTLNDKIVFYNTSSGLLESIRYILLRFGININGNIYQEKDKCYFVNIPDDTFDTHVKQIRCDKTCYYISIPMVAGITTVFTTSSCSSINFIWNNVVYSPITEKTRVKYNKDFIIELEMVDQTESGSNYLTAIGCAHNGGRRKGSATVFLQPWHIDFQDFLLLKRQHGAEERRARDLFYAVWNCDIFMQRVRDDKEWTLFCPKYAPMLKDTFGEEFNKWYVKYEEELAKEPGCEFFMRKMNARELWNDILTSQVETGMPFMVNKDTANYTSNQKNLGLIRSSNLCVEICEVTDEDTISSCNLASIALDEYVCIENGKKWYNHDKLGEMTRFIVRGLNRVIDRTFYPLQPTDKYNNIIGNGPIKETNLKYRPLGLGVQALADTFLKLGLAWTDPEARELNKEIFATIYYNAIYESIELAIEDGVYEGFYGSPASKGILKPDMISVERARKKLIGLNPESEEYIQKFKELQVEILNSSLSKRYDWDYLRNRVKEYGLRNSLLVALMPTASSAQIRYKNEAFEPFTTNMYVRSVLSGNHLIINRYMVAELEELNIWNKSVINFIMKNEGSIAKLPVELVDESKRSQLEHLKEKCKTVFELPQKLLMDMAIERSMYVCQSQSFNVHIKDPTFKQLTSLHFYAWENALTTGMYYLRTAPAVEAVKFTVEGELDVKKSVVCTEDICVSCQS